MGEDVTVTRLRLVKPAAEATTALTHENRMGVRFYLHEGRTKTGKARYFFARTVRDGAPSVVSSQISSQCPNKANEFGSVSTGVTNAAYTNVGWFFYRQANANPCTTNFAGYVSNNITFSSGLQSVTLTSSFPTVVFGGFSMGDYVAAIKRGISGGYLFPTWGQPVTSTGTVSPCVQCQGSWYRLRVQGTRACRDCNIVPHRVSFGCHPRGASSPSSFDGTCSGS
jgi:hypothetical protein